MAGCLVEVRIRRGLKVNGGKSKVMVLGGEEGLECEVCVDGIRIEHASVFWTNGVKIRQIVGGGYQVLLGLWLMLRVCSLSVLGSCMCSDFLHYSRASASSHLGSFTATS